MQFKKSKLQVYKNVEMVLFWQLLRDHSDIRIFPQLSFLDRRKLIVARCLDPVSLFWFLVFEILVWLYVVGLLPPYLVGTKTKHDRVLKIHVFLERRYGIECHFP